MKYNVFFLKGLVFTLISCVMIAGGCKAESEPAGKASTLRVYSMEKGKYIMTESVVKTEGEWEKLLTKEQFHILRQKGTEEAFSNKYWDNHAHGIYRCAGCGQDLFRSEDKFESGTGWPSFTAPAAPENIRTQPDNSLFMRRTEVLCSRCGGHLGHVFDDGPKPTGLRYCMNSGAMEFVAAK